MRLMLLSVGVLRYDLPQRYQYDVDFVEKQYWLTVATFRDVITPALPGPGVIDYMAAGLNPMENS